MKWTILQEGRCKCPSCGTTFDAELVKNGEWASCPICATPLLPASSTQNYAVIKTHTFDIDTDVNIFPTEEAALMYMQAEFLYYLNEEVRNESKLRETECAINSNEGFAQVVWDDGEKTEFRICPVYQGPSEGHEKEIPRKVLYELHKREWCFERGEEYSAVLERGKDLEGDTFPDLEEFLDCEFTIPNYIDAIISSALLLRDYDPTIAEG